MALLKNENNQKREREREMCKDICWKKGKRTRRKKKKKEFVNTVLYVEILGMTRFR